MVPSNLATSDLQIRPATLHDADELAILAASVFRHTYGAAIPPAILEPYLVRTFAPSVIQQAINMRGTTYLVAMLDQCLLGYSKCAVTTPLSCVVQTQAVELVNLYVYPAYHGRGIGRALLLQAMQLASQQGFTTLWLCAWQENHAALTFYQRAGFTTVGQTEIVVDGVIFVDWVMQRPLAGHAVTR